jgi:SAM-dependent methyltransferase
MTGDQQPADLLDLPFDQYQRYRIAEEVLNLLTAHGALPGAPAEGATPLTILDVGGYPGLLPRFVAVPGARTVVMDVVRDTSSAQRYGYTYVMGSGMELPFPDGSFDCVASFDTLEHIPASARPAFLAEMRRVARHAALLICPVFREETALAEQTLFEYIQWILKARQEQLDEHISYGLPDFPAARESFAAAGWDLISFPAGNLYSWLLMMVAKHYLIAQQDRGASEVERRLDRFFNLTFSASDRQEPGYRQVLVATATPQPAALAAITARFPPVAAGVADNLQRMELVQLLLRLFDLQIANHQDAGLREQLEHRDQHILGLEAKVSYLESHLVAMPALQAEVARLQGRDAEATQLRAALEQESALAEERHQMIARLQADLEQKNQHIIYLEQLLQKIEAGRVLRMTRSVNRLMGK